MIMNSLAQFDVLTNNNSLWSKFQFVKNVYFIFINLTNMLFVVASCKKKYIFSIFFICIIIKFFSPSSQQRINFLAKQKKTARSLGLKMDHLLLHPVFSSEATL